jgi:hypothetical protein
LSDALDDLEVFACGSLQRLQRVLGGRCWPEPLLLRRANSEAIGYTRHVADIIDATVLTQSGRRR